MVPARQTELLIVIEIAVIIPCYNEEATIAAVVGDFRASLPAAKIYVYDNNSRDETVKRALEAGAEVRRETAQGKGNVVRRMFADVQADIFVLVDGDDTYDAAAAPELIQKLIDDGLDIVSGKREATAVAAYRPGHVLGNHLLTGLTSVMFGVHLADMLSGYRVMSRRFVKSFPLAARGFGIETELTVHTVRMRLPMAEVATRYKERPAGSASKLNTWRDGTRILLTIVGLMRRERPLIFFTTIFAILALASLIIGIPVVIEYIQTGLVPRLPTAVLVTGMMVLAFLSLFTGLILDTVTRGRWEQKRIAYLSIPGPLELKKP
jgi:glycosyltransferase involved in cell wall biosynthesis